MFLANCTADHPNLVSVDIVVFCSARHIYLFKTNGLSFLASFRTFLDLLFYSTFRFSFICFAMTCFYLNIPYLHFHRSYFHFNIFSYISLSIKTSVLLRNNNKKVYHSFTVSVNLSRRFRSPSTFSVAFIILLAFVVA